MRALLGTAPSWAAARAATRRAAREGAGRSASAEARARALDALVLEVAEGLAQAAAGVQPPVDP